MALLRVKWTDRALKMSNEPIKSYKSVSTPVSKKIDHASKEMVSVERK